MSRLLTAFAALILSLSSAFALRFEGTLRQPVAVTVTAQTGLDGLYVLQTTAGASMVYTASGAASGVSVVTFGSQGAAYAVEADPSSISRNGNEVTVSTILPDTGYGFTENGRTVYYWITDYSRHPFNITAFGLTSDADCDRTFFQAVGSAPRMTYYSITGRGFEIDRGITLTYNTLTPDAENLRYISAQTTVDLPYIDGIFSAPAPLCDTRFELSGDRFLREWGEEVTVGTSSIQATAVQCMTSATQSKTPADNELKTDETLGGSAPIDITFTAAVTDAAIFTQWQMARDEEFEDVIYRTSDLEFDYTFTEMGTTYVRFTAANASGDCTAYGDTYSVYIGESALRCPNAFSPGASEGVNDEWRVSYKSIISFECYIFNRWGEKMAEFHDPAQGWDGRYKGKIVPAGVYYYVIKARGSDGKDYNLSGDINILNYK
ncbi:MAG: gliding motility-associated C-terminal domain-containing protein [Paramuribaculum sp.]